MKFVPQDVEGCMTVELVPFEDDRGSFARAFSRVEFAGHGLDPHIEQINIAVSRAPRTLRGIHWQAGTSAEAKLVRCVNGRVFDVCVDVRPESPTFGQWVGVELSPDNGLALYIPTGCGHAYLTLEPDTTLMYTASTAYDPEAEMGARWDDSFLNIQWPYRTGLTMSEKDRSLPGLNVQ